MSSLPWSHDDWLETAATDAAAAVTAAGCVVAGPFTTVKSWGRAHLATLAVEDGTLWIKHAYRLPPGEEVVLATLATRESPHLPEVVATWPGGFAIRELPGAELSEEDSLETWCDAARVIAVLAAAEEPHADEWLAMGVRDRRPTAFADAVDELLEGEAIAALEPEWSASFRASRNEFVDRYEAAFTPRPTLVQQDSGCCNIHVGDHEPVLFDWADVVVGHPAYGGDRLLDQVPAERQEAVIDAFCEPLEMTRAAFKAARRSNVLHEILRYHDELAYLPRGGEVHASLTKSVQSQVRVLMRHEARRR